MYKLGIIRGTYHTITIYMITTTVAHRLLSILLVIYLLVPSLIPAIALAQSNVDNGSESAGAKGSSPSDSGSYSGSDSGTTGFEGSPEVGPTAAAQTSNDAVAAEVAAGAGAGISVTPVDASAPNAPAPGSSVNVNGVQMGVEDAKGALDAIGKSNGVADVQATLAAWADPKGTIEAGQVVGPYGHVGLPEAVAKGTAEARAGINAISMINGLPMSTLDARSLNVDLNSWNNIQTRLDVINVVSTPVSRTPTGQIEYANVVGVNNDAKDKPQTSPEYETRMHTNADVAARMAAAGFNSDGSLQRAVTIDYSNIMGVTKGTVKDYQDNNTLDSKIALEQNMIGMALNSNIDKAQLGQVDAKSIDSHGKIDNQDTNGAFAKSLGDTIVPGLWENSDIESREQFLTSYFGNIVGWTPNQAGGIVGNLKTESGNGLNHLAWGDRNLSQSAYGMMQARLDRKDALEEFAGQKFVESNGRLVSGPNAWVQAAFVAGEMKGTIPGHQDRGAEKAGREFAQNPNMTTNEAAKTFMDYYERPSDKAKMDSIGGRQNNARSALESYNNVDPGREKFNTGSVAAQPTRPGGQGGGAGNDQPSRQGSGPGQLEFGIGGLQITIDLGKTADLFNNLFSMPRGDGGVPEYTDLSFTGSEDSENSLELERVDISPGRPGICPAGPTEEGFSFNIKFLNRDHTDQVYSCKGQTTADNFNIVTSYLKNYNTDSVQDVDVLSKMRVTSSKY